MGQIETARQNYEAARKYLLHARKLRPDNDDIKIIFNRFSMEFSSISDRMADAIIFTLKTCISQLKITSINKTVY